jgi:chitosanase
MTFTNADKLKALAIVHIFETSKAFGDYAACVVLNDGAGVSYGINQFTHRSGSLLEVVKTYLEKGGQVGRAAIEESLPLLKQKGAGAIGELAGNTRFKKALKAAAVTREMRESQHEIAEKRYLRPAIEAAEGSGFTLPLTLAVIYDSINHGSYARIRDRVKIARKNYSSDVEFEKAWVYSYVKNRDAWLESVPRLAVTDYRTDFFLAQIARGNWNLELPVNVHGLKLERVESREPGAPTEAEPGEDPAVEPFPPTDNPILPENTPISLPETPENVHTSAQPPDILGGDAEIREKGEGEKRSGGEEEESRADEPEPGTIVSGSPLAGSDAGGEASPLTRHEGSLVTRAGEIYETAAGKFDRVSDVVGGISTRKDAAKSMWTTIGSTIWQSIWAVVAFIIGLPREVWLTVAIIAGAFMLYYLYRQISLGKIRERAGRKL